MKETVVSAGVSCPRRDECSRARNGSCGYSSLLDTFQVVGTVRFDPSERPDSESSLESQTDDLLAQWRERQFGPCTDNPFRTEIHLYPDTGLVSKSPWKNV